MRANLGHLALVQHDQAIGAAQRGQPVRDRKGGSPLHQSRNGQLDPLLCRRIQRRGGLVEDQNPGIVKDRPGDGDPLSLPHGELAAPLTHLGVVSIRLADDEFVGLRGHCGPKHLAKPRLGLAVGDVLGYRAVEQKRLLVDHSGLAAQVQKPDFPHVGAIDLDRPAIRIVEPADQVDQRRLSHARLAHQPDHLAWGDVEVDAFQDGLARIVAEGHPLEGHPPLQVFGRCRAGVLEGLRRGVDHLEDPVRARESAEHEVVEITGPSQRMVEHPEVADKGDEGAQGHLSAKDLSAAEVPDEEHAPAHQEVRHREEDEPVPFPCNADRPQLLVPLVEAVALALLLSEGLHHPDSGDGLVQVRVKLRPFRPPPAPVSHHPGPDQAPGDHDGRDGKQHEDRQRPVGGQQ